jgi:hypothetical protein
LMASGTYLDLREEGKWTSRYSRMQGWVISIGVELVRMTKLTDLTCELSDSLGSDGRAIKKIPYRGGAVLRSLDLTPYRRSYNPWAPPS